MPADSTPRVRKTTMELWLSDAIVLYDWLMSVDEDAIPVEHRAEKQALRDLLTALETQTPVEGVSQADIDLAREEVAAAMPPHDDE